VDLGPRQHGSDMIEPAALSKPTMVGPFTGNFAEAMRKFTEANAMSVVSDDEQLGATLDLLLSNPGDAIAMGKRALGVVMNQQGATLRNAEVILGELRLSSPPPQRINRPLAPQ
jgi:3-deoxy-D-manno-octulosonic-acid transferase